MAARAAVRFFELLLPFLVVQTTAEVAQYFVLCFSFAAAARRASR